MADASEGRIAQLEATVKTLVQRIEKLEAAKAVRDLQHIYGYYLVSVQKSRAMPDDGTLVTTGCHAYYAFFPLAYARLR